MGLGFTEGISEQLLCFCRLVLGSQRPGLDRHSLRNKPRRLSIIPGDRDGLLGLAGVDQSFQVKHDGNPVLHILADCLPKHGKRPVSVSASKLHSRFVDFVYGLPRRALPGLSQKWTHARPRLLCQINVKHLHDGLFGIGIFLQNFGIDNLGVVAIAHLRHQCRKSHRDIETVG